MSTPVDLNITMPYGVTIEGNGSKLPQIVGSHPKRRTSISLNIPSGPCRVGLSWDGPEGIQLLHYSGGSQRIIAGEITAKTGGGSRQIIVSIGAKDGDWVQCQTWQSAPSTSRGTLEVFPTNFE